MRKHLGSLLNLLGAVAAAVAAVVMTAPGALAQTPTAVPGEIVVKVPAGMAEADVRALADEVGCEVQSRFRSSSQHYTLRVKSVTRARTRSQDPTDMYRDAGPVLPVVNDAVAKLRAKPGVLADPNLIQKRIQTPSLTPNDPLFTTNQAWHMDMINMRAAWGIQVGIRPVVVAVVDSGVDPNHPDFRSPDGSTSRIVAAQNFFPDGGPNSLTDLSGHGTHVAGTVAATTNNGLGVAGVAGWNRGNVNVNIVASRVFGMSGGAPFSVIIDGMLYAGTLANPRVDVMNLSLGGYGSSQVQADAVATIQAAGVIIVAGLGNDNIDNTDPNNQFFPANFPGVIAVTAVGPGRTKASYSNFGGNVTITAPGGEGDGGPEAIWSTWPTNATGIAPNARDYYGISGTSMATPHVAGAVALMIAAGAPKDINVITKALQDSAQDLGPDPQNFYGAGLLDVYGALLPFSNPDPVVTLNGPLDRGATYDRNLPISMTVVGVNKLAQASVVVRVETATIPATVVRQFVMGQDFPIPTLAPGEPAATPKSVSLPITPALSAGRYKVVVSTTFNGQTTESTQFFEIIERRQPLGRSMFSIPFRAADVDPNPEKAVLGTGTSFKLRRYNPLNPAGGTEAPGYFTFSSTGQPAEVDASFKATGPGGSPISFDVANPFGSIAPVGLGYWLDLEDTRTLNLIGPKVDTTVGIKLFAANGGWNMIGAPFTAPVDWSSVSIELPALVGTQRLPLAEAVEQGIINGVLVGYREGEYVYNVAPSGRFEPFQGYWVRALQDCTLIIAPSSASLTRAQPTVGSGPNMKGWRARIIASVAGDRDGQNYFGQVDGAKLQEDRFDIQKPPAGAGHAYVRFVADKADGRATALAYDMRSPGTGRQEWTVAVSTDRENADVTLSWDGISNAPRRSRLVLKDAVTGQVIPMSSRSSFNFKGGEAGSTRLFKIVLEPSASGGPLQIMNVTSVNASGSRSATGGSALNVRFTVNRDADVQASVRTMTGKPVATLTGPSRAAGMKETTLRWDGRTRSGGSVAAGPYLLEVTARSADGEVTTIKRAIQYLR